MLCSILKYYTKTKYNQTRFKTRAALRHYQKKQWEKFKRRVLAHSHFYEKYLNQPFCNFPIMDKTTMMANFDQINTRMLTTSHALDVALKAETTRDFSPMIGDISVGLSSGTSGQRGLFAVSAKERAYWVGSLLAQVLPQGLKRKESIAFFLRANNQLYEALSKSNRLHFELAVAPELSCSDKAKFEYHLNQLFIRLECKPPQWHWVPLTVKSFMHKRRRIQYKAEA